MPMPPEHPPSDAVVLLPEPVLPGALTPEPAAAFDPPTEGVAVLTPKGPTGLMRALAAASRPGAGPRELPTSDIAQPGTVVSLFDYDAALVVDLDGNPRAD